MPNFAAFSDAAIRNRIADHWRGDVDRMTPKDFANFPSAARPYLTELARRGLVSTPETIAELHAARRKYHRLACMADSEWGYGGRRRR